MRFYIFSNGDTTVGDYGFNITVDIEDNSVLKDYGVSKEFETHFKKAMLEFFENNIDDRVHVMSEEDVDVMSFIDD